MLGRLDGADSHPGGDEGRAEHDHVRPDDREGRIRQPEERDAAEQDTARTECVGQAAGPGTSAAVAATL